MCKERQEAGDLHIPGFYTLLFHKSGCKFRVKRKTSQKKFRKKCKEMNTLIRDMRSVPVKDIIKKLNEILVGYYHYYGITDNSQKLKDFQLKVKRLLYFWLNRRSQKKSYIWDGFGDMLKVYPLGSPK